MKRATINDRFIDVCGLYLNIDFIWAVTAEYGDPTQRRFKVRFKDGSDIEFYTQRTAYSGDRQTITREEFIEKITAAMQG